MATSSSTYRAGQRVRPPKLTHLEIISLFQRGIYVADLDRGLILRKGKPIYTYVGKTFKNTDNDYLWCRLYHKGRKRAISVSNVIWIVGCRSPIPTGFEIHHKDRNKQNNAFDNLFALHKVDHDKLHRGIVLIDEPEVETPF